MNKLSLILRRAHIAAVFSMATRVASTSSPPLGRELGAALRDERHDVRAHAIGDRDHLVAGGHLQVEHRGQRRAQPGDVVVLDVPAIFPAGAR